MDKRHPVCGHWPHYKAVRTDHEMAALTSLITVYVLHAPEYPDSSEAYCLSKGILSEQGHTV
jgi:hypothetical protein